MKSFSTNGNPRILVIDDNQAIHDDFRKILGAPEAADAALEEAEAKIFGTRPTAPFEIDAASQGEEGWTMVGRALAEGRPYAMAFVDVRMPPGWDGIETTKRIWQVAPDMQIVICTAFADCSWTEMQEQIKPLDRLLILKKPFDSIEVLQLANALTMKWRLQQESKNKLADLDEMVKQRTRELEASQVAALNMMEDAVRNGEKVSRAYEELKSEMAERQRAEQALRESEERYRKLVELSPDAILIHGQGKLVLANRAAVGLFGATAASELQGRAVLEFVHPDSQALVKERIRKLEEPSSTLPVVEEKLLRLDGSSFDAEVNTAPFVFQGRPSALVIIRNITEKKALNAKLLRTQRLESIGTLAGGIAHDLNNVLAPILMSIELLQMRITDEASRRVLSTIGSSATRGAELVKQVLTFSRGLQGAYMPVQLRHVIREMQAIIRETFPKSITLRTQLAEENWTVNGDATQLHQVLMNLCVNARDAMPNGGTLNLKTENLVLDEAFARMNPEARVGPYVVLTATDTGTGMPPAIRDRIFEPFFTTKELGKGTGLGLSTVLGIAKGHGGFVTVYSEVGHGTSFKVYLPAQPSAEAQRADSTRPALPMGRGELILVADDEVAIQQIAKETLQMCGYRVLTANHGAEAVAICAQQERELKLLVTDMMMPIMDGLATVRAIRLLAPTVRIIAASGLGSETKECDPEKLGVDAFLKKPFTAETLLRTVAETLGA